MPNRTPKLQSRLTPGADLQQLEQGSLRLQIPAGPAGQYRLAQLDDYSSLSRKAFPWRPGSSVQVQMRACAGHIPGTWGVGFWNNPFGLAILKGVEMLRLPALPEAAWYFFASPPNYLSLRDDMPAQGPLAATFHTQPGSKYWLALAAPLAPLIPIPVIARLLRKLLRRTVGQDSCSLPIDPTGWHRFRLEWQAQRVIFELDGQTIFETGLAPAGPLGLVLWIDNQFAAFPADGRLRFGSLENPQAVWIEIKQLLINGQEPVLE